MFKRVLLGLAILASTAGVASAAVGPVPYLGAGLGIATNTSNGGGSFLFGSNRGVPFNLLAGYGGLINDSFYLAGELNGTVGTAVVSNNGSLKTTYSYGADRKSVV